jgi:hypothetical protein
MKYLVVAVVGLLMGGVAIPGGFALGLSALETWLAAVAGGVGGMLVFVLAGGHLRGWIIDKANISEEAQQRGKRVLGRFGVRGLGLIGPIFPGVTASVLIGVTAGADRRDLVRWMTIGIVGLYGIYAFGLALLIELF